MKIARLPIIDRIRHARELASGKRVLDIGGQKMPNCDPKSKFAFEYSKIQLAASDYRIVDYQNQPEIDYVLDLNNEDNIRQLAKIIEDFEPDLILCMEVLEHLNHPCLVMNAMSELLERNNDSCIFITVPNNQNWIFNALGWNVDHNIAFFRDIAFRFISRSELGRHEVTMYG